MSPHRLDDDALEHALVDWSLYARDENGDLEPAAWQQVDALLDEYGRRLGLPGAPARPCWNCGGPGRACCEYAAA